VADQSLGAPARPDRTTRLITVTVRYFAAARAAAGVTEERLTIASSEELASPDSGGAALGGVTVAVVLAEATDRHGPGLATILRRCSYLLDEVAVHGTGTIIRDGQVLDVLPPFAGG